MTPRRPLHPYLMLLPTGVVLLVFFIIPLVLAIKNSFFTWDLITPPTYVGLGNYAVIAANGELFGTLRRTLVYSAVVVSSRWG